MAERIETGSSSGDDPLCNTQTIRKGLSSASMSQRRLAFLAKLPFFLNSSLSLQRVVQIALEHILEELQAEFGVVYLYEREELLTYWSLVRDPRQRAEGQTILSEHPSAQMVIDNNFPLVLQDPKDLSKFKLNHSFGRELQNLICIPLLVRDKECVGVFQIANLQSDFITDASSLAFCEQFSHQLALAVDNARLFQEAQEHRQQLVALDRKKSETISIIAHEFRTPLNIIQNAAEILSSSSVTDDNRGEMLSLLQSSVQRLTRLIAQIRNVSLVQDEDIEVELEYFDIARLASLVAAKFEQVVTHRDLQLVVLRPPGQVPVLGEPRLLSVVLQNLLSNAVRFTPDNGSIILQIEEQGEHVRVSVVDTGIGIAGEQQALVFEKFYEVKDSMSHSSGDYEFQSSGLGLGLAAVKHILAAHQSEIRLESKVGEGSSFSFTLERLSKKQ